MLIPYFLKIYSQCRFLKQKIPLPRREGSGRGETGLCSQPDFSPSPAPSLREGSLKETALNLYSRDSEKAALSKQPFLPVPLSKIMPSGRNNKNIIFQVYYVKISEKLSGERKSEGENFPVSQEYSCKTGKLI
jgi:hypothetical protein